MTPRLFIERPVLSWVIALTILLAGILALRALPIEQYPQIAPPSVTIEVTYPGADASVVAENVTQVIEQELNGVEGFQYMSSSSRQNGATLTVTFEPGTDIDVAQMDVQNRLSAVEPRLPEEVRRQGVQVFQRSESILMIIALISRSGSTGTLELGNFAAARVVDELRRVEGVGDVFEFSSPYAMRVWLDPERLSSYRLSPSDALAAVRAQNSQAAGGALGGLPLAEGTELSATLQTQGRFSRPEEFASIILRANADGSSVRLGDVADVELGAQSYLFSMELAGQPAAGMAIQLATDANALATSDRLEARMTELAAGFPDDIDWTIAFDTTPFIRISIEEVLVTLSIAMALIVLVMFVFLQSWRSTLIPTIVVPIALAGGGIGLWLFGFSINVLTLFAMVLAIGILVDDAIVVVENVERIVDEEGLPALEATVKAMGQITTAIIATTLVLISVFVPMAFFPGATGSIYRQFSLTLVTSIAFSTLLALTLTPALCAAMLTRKKAGVRLKPFALFNRGLKRVTERHQRAVRWLLAKPLAPLAVFAVLAAGAALLFVRMPSSFVPNEDQGVLLTIVQAPPGATIERTNEAVEQVVGFYRQNPHVERTALVRGFSFFGQGQSNAMAFVTLTPWDERDETASASALVARASAALSTIKEAMVFVLNPPPIPELGQAGGFTFMLQDRAGRGHDALLDARNQLLGAASQSPVLTQVRPEGQPDAPQLRVDIDRITARALGLSIPDVNETLSIAMGSAYANDFIYDGRVLRVLVEAAAPHRMTARDVLDLEVRSDTGGMVPFGAFTTVEWTSGPTELERYNGYPAVTIAGSPAPGFSTGEALDEMERLAASLPEGFSFEWTGLSYEERQAAGQVAPLLALSVVAVFLVLAALYESWSIPVAVLLVVPFGVLGAVLASMSRGLPADVYFNIGLITLIGLSARNAILIVQFAIEEEAAGKRPWDATLGAVRLRLRPILMTSFTFIFAMVPLVLSSGAGAASRIAVGTGVMGGMIAATAFGVFFTPLLYFVIRDWISRRRPGAPRGGSAAAAVVLLVAVGLVGCQLAPAHERPPMPTASEYPSEYVDDALEGARASEVGWRAFIDDDRLEALIGAALERNRDLTVAIARIDEARGGFAVQRSERVPAVAVTAEATRSQIVAGGAVGGFPSGAGGVVESRSANVGVAAFELDFWGRVRNLTEAALAEYLATTSAARAAALSLIREVSDAYLGLLEADARIRLAEATVESRREELEIAERRLDAGAVSALEVAQVETLLTQAETELAALRLQQAQSRNALAVLVGGPIETELPEPAPLGTQASAEPLAAGLPSELLAARPDIVAAEEQLRASRANVGAARAAFFPSISLTARSGYSSSELDGLFSQDGSTWTFGPSLSVPIFDFGRRRGNMTIAEARERVAVAEYERTIQTAFREVADALAGRRFLAQQVAAQERATQAQRDLAELARRRYSAGVVSYLEVLDAERNLFAAEQALLQIRRAEEANLIALYVALGGDIAED